MNFSLCAVMVACMIGALPAVALAEPPNDHFADRQALDDPLPIAIESSNVRATIEEGEPDHGFASAGRSIWFEWVADADGYVTVGTCGTAFTTNLGVYTGSALNALTLVADSTYGGPGCAEAGSQTQGTFYAESGVAYAISIDGYGFRMPDAPPPVTEGTVNLRLERTPPPDNDDFAAARHLVGEVGEEPNGARPYFARAFGYSWGATKEPQEPDHAGDPGGSSVWYSWTAPASGQARISVVGLRYRPVLAVYTGDDPADLTEVAAGPEGWLGLTGMAVEAGRTYKIAVDGRQNPGLGDDGVGTHDLVLMMDLPPRQPDLAPLIPPISAPPPADTVAPQTIVTQKKVRPRQRLARFLFTASETASFVCRLNRRSAVPCAAPKAYRQLKPGRHTFRVYAIDAAGNADRTAATARFTIAAPKRGR